MSEDRGTSGVHISGGHVTIGALAQGTNASAHAVIHARPDAASPPDEVLAMLPPLLTQLRDALAGHEEELPAARAATAELAENLSQPQPPWSRVKELVATITAAAGSATAVAEAAEAIGKALG
jgi:hypothetical protein